MDATTPSTDDELDLDVSFVDSGLEVAGVSSEDCTSDGCDDSHDENCFVRGDQLVVSCQER